MEGKSFESISLLAGPPYFHFPLATNDTRGSRGREPQREGDGERGEYGCNTAS